MKFFLKLLKAKLCRHDWTEVDRFLEVDEEQEAEKRELDNVEDKMF